MEKKGIKKIGKLVILLAMIGVLLSGCVDSVSNEKEDIDDKGEDIVGTNEDTNETIDANITEDTNKTEDANITEDVDITEEQYIDTNETIEENVTEDYTYNETEQTSGEEIVDNARIESDSAIINSNGLKITLRIYNDEGNVNESEGTLNTIIYDIEDSDEGSIKGNELDRWELQITDSDYGENNELIKTLEYHRSVTSSSGFISIDYIFITKDGQNLETSDEYINFS